MKRRDFIKNTTLVAAGLCSVPVFAKGQSYRLVNIRGGSPSGMLDLGINALGGIGKFVKKGQKVLIKPTLGWESSPEEAANTNPTLLAHLIELCYEAESRAVFLFDQTFDIWTKAYKSSGIERAAKDAHAKVLPGNKESLYHEIQIPNGRVMKTAKLYQALEDVDVIINVPVLKADKKFGFSGAMINLERLMWHENECVDENRAQCLLDLIQYKKPVLNIIDAYRVIAQNGPKGKSKEDVKLFKTLIISADIVAADAYAARRLGLNPKEIELLKLAQEQDLGQIELASNQIKNIILKQQAVDK